MPSAMPLGSPSDTAAWLDLFTQPAACRPERTADEAVAVSASAQRDPDDRSTHDRQGGPGITNMLGLDPSRHQKLLRTIVKDRGIKWFHGPRSVKLGATSGGSI
jgi:hypothetical protein